MHNAFAQQFQVEGVAFSMRDRLMMIHVDTPFAQVVLTPHGASVLSYVPKVAGELGEDLLWVSSQAVYHGQKPVRGGIPVCWPWFGKGKEAGQMAHGFVRNMSWRLQSVDRLPSGATEVVFALDANEQTLAQWPHQFHLQLRVEIGETLALTLTTLNLNAYDIEITEALHTYFKVAQAPGIVIHGLQGSTHLDKLEDTAPAEIQSGPIKLQPPMDSVYLNQEGEIRIEDAVLNRQIGIETDHAASSVVWNPGKEIVKGFEDIDAAAWSEFVCVESGNVLDNAVIVPAECKHSMTVVYRAAPLSEPR